MSRKTIAFALLAACLPHPLLAASAQGYTVSRPVEEKNVASGKQQIDPAKGYIYFHGPARQNILLLKTPSDEQRAAFEADWKKAFDKAKSKYPGQLKSWQADAELAKKSEIKLGPKPVEPTEQTFSIGNIESRMQVQIGPQFVYAKGDSDYGYLQEVEPGTYTIYGPIFLAANGAVAGKCFCMGTVKFEVVPGKITNLGDFMTLRWMGADELLRARDPALAGKPPQPVNYDLPASLTAKVNQRADLRAAGKMNNFFGIMIDRMPAVPGVLGYQRDKVIDLKAQTADAAPAG
ncbi:MAG: hypothetical protein J2O44_07535 [Porphyrobacter sp.]|nr:hypothetical protein [Porphyrobacter sp.]